MLYAKCPTCKMLLADKQIPYEERVKKECSDPKLSPEEVAKRRKKILSDLGLTRYCCRMRIISYVDYAKVVV